MTRWEKKLLKRDEQEEVMVTLKTAGGDGLQKPESSCAKEYSKVHLMRLQRSKSDRLSGYLLKLVSSVLLQPGCPCLAAVQVNKILS